MSRKPVNFISKAFETRYLRKYNHLLEWIVCPNQFENLTQLLDFGGRDPRVHLEPLGSFAGTSFPPSFPLAVSVEVPSVPCILYASIMNPGFGVFAMRYPEGLKRDRALRTQITLSSESIETHIPCTSDTWALNSRLFGRHPLFADLNTKRDIPHSTNVSSVTTVDIHDARKENKGSDSPLRQSKSDTQIWTSPLPSTPSVGRTSAPIQSVVHPHTPVLSIPPNAGEDTPDEVSTTKSTH